MKRTLGLVLGTYLLASCTAGTTRPDSGAPEMDAGRDAGPADSGPRTCTTTAECDDGHACTLDECVVGNVCDYTPLDSRCADGERCVVGRGCVTSIPTDCTVDADCDDGLRCTGTERCLRETCVPGTPIDCDDGNACTEDVCDEAAASACRYEVAAGCDAGVTNADAGPGCDPFEPTTDYTGSWRILPAVRCDAGLGRGYSIDNATFSISGDMLTLTMGRFTLTQSPAPTGADFDVTGSDGCATVRLMGTMACDTQFNGTWTATHSGDCGVCGTTNVSVAGRM